MVPGVVSEVCSRKRLRDEETTLATNEPEPDQRTTKHNRHTMHPQ